MNFNKCNLVDIIWIERGILLMLIYFIIKNYNNLEKKKIVINNKKLRNFLQGVFLNLNFLDKFEKNKSDYFYFNIRSIQKNQDIIIDYLKNYDEFIPTKKIWLVPYYDLNDPLIIYKFNKKAKLDADLEKDIVKNFTCPRGNYQNSGVFWDINFENTIINKAKNFGLINISNLINNFLLEDYTDTSIKKNNITNFIYPIVNYTGTSSKKDYTIKQNDINNFRFKTEDLLKSKKEIIKLDIKSPKKEDTTIESDKKEDTVDKSSKFDKAELENEGGVQNRKKMINLINLIGEKINNLNNLNNIKNL
jgi:hypothetical protein